MFAARILAALLPIVASCAPRSASSEGESPSTLTRPPAPKNPNVISMEELRDPVVVGMDALKAIRTLRPAFFRRSGPQSYGDPSAGAVQISPDYGPLQPVSQLSSFSPTTLVEVRYLDANEAQLRFGVRANGGPVIVLLSTRK